MDATDQCKMNDDYVYATPPLVEVIAEVHWETQKIASIPGGGVDPFYSACLDAIRKNSHFGDFRHEEHLMPDQVPIEFFSNKPLVRFRKQANSWPLYQLGPGIFVTNLTPPYQGWQDFKKILAHGLRALFANYPYADTQLKISKLELRYVDAFTKRHGFENYAVFLTEGLGMSLQVPATVLNNSADGEMKGVVTNSEVSFPLKKLPSSRGIISVGLGESSREKAVVAQFACTYEGATLQPQETTLLDWFDTAHMELRDWFEQMVSNEVKGTFGAPTKIGN